MNGIHDGTLRRACQTVASLSLGIALTAGLLLLASASSNHAQTHPTVTQIIPDTVANDTAHLLSIRGSSFVTLPTVTVGTGPLLDVGYISSATLTATLPSGFAAGVYTVTVTNPGGLAGSLPSGLTVQNPIPTLYALSPDSGVFGRLTELTITATDLVATPTVSLGTIPCPSVGYVSSTTLTTTVPVDLLPGMYSLVVTNPGPGAPNDVLHNAFTQFSPVPLVESVAPNLAPNDLDTRIVISGTGFAPTPTVALETLQLENVTWLSLTHVAASVPWGMDEGTYDLTIVNPSPGEASAVMTQAFTVAMGIDAWTFGELYGGSVSQIVPHPITPTTLYASSSIGLFRSQDGGDSWSFKLSSGNYKIAIEPLSPNHVFLSDLELLRSGDGGETWIPLATTLPVTQAADRDCWKHFTAYPISDATYLAACGSDGRASGLFRSTDHGETWLPTMGGLADTQVTALAFHPTDPQTMYLGTASGNVYISHNGGASWAFASRPAMYIHDLDVNPYDAHEVWVSAGHYLGDPCGLYKSTNPELTAWTSIGAPAFSPGHVWCSADVTFAPRSWPGVASDSVFVVSEGSGYRSTDSGATWYPFGVPQWVHDLALHPTDPDIFFIGEGGGGEGIYRTLDGGSTWHAANHGLTAIVPEQIHTVPDQPDTAYVIALQNVYRTTQGGQEWLRLPMTGALSILLDPVTPTRIYAGTAGGVRISEDEGKTWPVFTEIAPPAEYAECSLWVDALSAVPEQPGSLLAGIRHFDWSGACVTARGSIYRSTDHGKNWQRIALGPEISQITDLAWDPISPAVVYAAMGSDDESAGGLLKSTDGGQTWAPVSDGQDGLGYVGQVEVEPGTHRVYIWSGPAGGRISDDLGATWGPCGDPLPGFNTNQILFTSGERPVLYAATVGGPDGPGLYRSIDGAESWTRAAGVLGRVPVYALGAGQTEDRVILYASTTGGYVESTLSSASIGTNGDTTLVNAGLYRYTTRRLFRRTYLPLALSE